MDETHSGTTDARELKAREWIQTLTEFPDRLAGSIYERRAAERIGDWMKELGFSDVTVVGARGGPRPGLTLALHAGLGLLGCYWGGVIGIVMTVLSLWSFRSEFRQRLPFLSRLLPAGDSVNVVARRGPAQAVRRIILTAHIDTTEAGWMFSRGITDLFARANARQKTATSMPPLPPHAGPELLLIGGAVVAFAAWAGAHGILFGLVKLAICIGLLAATALGVQWFMSPPTPGANDNASAVAAMLTCADTLRRELPEDLELWVVGTGAEECGSGGMHDIVERHPEWSPANTFYINFECVGGGNLHYIVSEGLLARVSYPATMLELARRLAAGGGFGDVTPTHLLAGTDGSVPAREGYPTLSLISLEANGVPRNYHRLEDTVDGIDLGMVVRSADFGAAVARSALNGGMAPIRG